MNPDEDYVVMDVGSEHLLIAEALVDNALQRYGIDSADVSFVARFAGRELEGVLLQHPFYPRQVPIILGEHVTMEAGTGAVHTAPGAWRGRLCRRAEIWLAGGQPSRG